MSCFHAHLQLASFRLVWRLYSWLVAGIYQRIHHALFLNLRLHGFIENSFLCLPLILCMLPLWMQTVLCIAPALFCPYWLRCSSMLSWASLGWCLRSHQFCSWLGGCLRSKTKMVCQIHNLFFFLNSLLLLVVPTIHPLFMWCAADVRVELKHIFYVLVLRFAGWRKWKYCLYKDNFTGYESKMMTTTSSTSLHR